jgi:pimeloyl-ACP methyl ester carboxylesterase
MGHVEVEELVVRALPSAPVHVNIGGEGDAVLVLHRDTGRHGWTDFHAALAAQYRVIAPAFPGFDVSPAVPWMRSVNDLARILGRALDHLGIENCQVVGLGFGGFVAAELLASSPHRFTRVVLHSPMGLKPDGEEILDQFLWSSRDYLRMGFVDEQRFATRFPFDADAMFGLLEPNRETVTQVAWKPYMFSRQLPHLLGGVTVPTAVLWSEQDRIVPRSCAERYVELLNGTYSALPGAGHQVDLEDPARLAACVRDALYVSLTSASAV